MTLGQRIQKGRKEAGLSQEELAEQLGVSRQAVSRWENDNGYPEMEKIIRLSQIYQVSLDYLVGNEQEKPGEDISEKGWYVSNELAESFLAHQKSKLQAAYNRERSGNERLTNRLEEVLEENRELRIVATDFERIKAVVGSEQVNAVINRVKQQEQIEAEQKRAARRKHNRDAR